ncbi:hypothetical protein G7045_11320 [Acidovorax sp. HDW3]|uniref:hypothetical protein n=1 Tax=Acidovorax sp. HDW3 TaxID=2714923 RepID=UPI00140E5C08|nr:hypothetical protein [Acidovorax sp. HDW3]QIL44806.1 hypothetical protein G7045_11320 [Acidovorax sp. HDW3]
MFSTSHTERVGDYVVTPLAKSTEQGFFIASVSIRRGVYDRIFRFIPRFSCAAQAAQYALTEGRSLVLSNQLG